MLIGGLVAGAALPGLAEVLRAYLPELVALLLFLTAFRVGLRAVLGSLLDMRRVLFIVACLQLVAPLLAVSVFSALDVLTHPFAIAVTMMLAAPSVTGSPNFLIMMGKDPSHALRILVVGTAAFPITVIPVLWSLPFLDSTAAVNAAIWLIAVIICATALGFAGRRAIFVTLPDRVRTALDGASAIVLAIVVVGLMSEIGPLMASDPRRLITWAVAVCALNFGLQIATYAALRRTNTTETLAISVISGNRNIALFLIALPAEIMGPLLVFIGCYQIPMYLTPILLRRLYAEAS